MSTPMSQPMSLSTGEVFAGYTVIRPLGAGAMGEVYLAGLPRLSRRDALRLLPVWVTADRAVRARFERDADLAATLQHPNIADVHGRGEDRGRLWLAADFVDGTAAAQLVRDRYPGGMPVEEVLDIVTAVADAVDHAHGRQLSHGAVTPANIFLAPSPRPRILLTDFGIPRPAGVPDDRYALAATARYLLTGSPALGPTPVDLAPFEPALARALATDPAAWFTSCGDFAAALRDGLTGVANTVVAPIPLGAYPTARLDSPETGPKQPVFTPAWSEEPPPNPYLDPDPFLDDPYPDPDPAHSPTMTAMPVSAYAPHPGSPPEEPPAHPPGPTGRTWAMAGIGAAVALVIALVVVALAGGGGADEAQPKPRPQSATTAPPSASPSASPSTQPTSTAAPATTDRGRAAPPPVAGPDGVGETCLDGYQITGQAGWASHGVRGNPAATCAFVGNVLRAYWNAADPSDAPRTVIAAGAIPCSDGAQCSGSDFVVTCEVVAPDPWVTCRGGRNAVVYLY